jgi:LemA protein
MKKSTIIIIVVAVLAVVWGITGYNGLVSMDEGVQTKWADVETQYQRRADLIPNLVNTVKGYAAHESETLQAVVEARAKATSMNIDPSNMSAEQIANFQKAQDGVSSALGRLLVTVEKYPDLKANENFRELQAQLEGTENRISVARRDYNEAARKYNTSLRSFPKNILAGMFGFEKKAYFEAQEGSEQAPTVQF